MPNINGKILTFNPQVLIIYFIFRDRNKLTFYFSADRRIDFRELVRDLFRIYKTRIWMCAVDKNRANLLNSLANDSN